MLRTRPLVRLAVLLALPGLASGQVYLNDQNISVALGASMAPEPFANHTAAQGLARLIDAPSADAPEDHTQSTHVWVSGGHLELDFDLGVEYDLQALHIWNYFGEGFDVDNIDFLFFDAEQRPVGTLLGVEPALGGAGGNPIFAEDIPLAFPSKVRFVNATLTGSNGEVDLNNLGFTGESSCGQASFENYGDGWSGANGVPSLTLDGQPLLGSSVQLLVSNEAGIPAETCLLLGDEIDPLPTTFGGSLLVDVAVVIPVGMVPVEGASVAWSIPRDPALCGMQLTAQAVQYDTGASMSVAFSPGLRAVLGDI